VSQQDDTRRQPDIDQGIRSDAPTPVPGHPATAQGEPDPDAPTIGTGTSLALGCIAGTLLLIVIGLIYILILALV
jgi:hypothetical protein